MSVHLWKHYVPPPVFFSVFFFFFFFGKIRLKFQYVIASVIPNGITGRWLAAPPASCRGGEGRDRLSGALYVRLCAPLRDQGRNAPARREEKHQRRRARDRQTLTHTHTHTHTHSRDLDIYPAAVHSSATAAGCAQRIHTDSILHFIPSAAAAAAAERSGGRKKKFGEMQSVYQHLISLLFVFSSLHLHQLTEGCSCALTHPQDAFCNSDIGMCTARIDRFTAINDCVLFIYFLFYYHYFSESTLG